jgi:hypothetical protein
MVWLDASLFLIYLERFAAQHARALRAPLFFKKIPFDGKFWDFPRR